MDWVTGKSKFNNDGTPSMIDELRLYIMGAAAFFTVMIVIGLLTLLKKFYNVIMKLVKKIYNMMVFNGTIRSITIVYIKFCISFGKQIEMYMKGNMKQTNVDKAIALTMFVALFGYPIFSWIVIKRYKATLHVNKVGKRIANLYQDIRLRHKHDYHLVYYPIFLGRRIMFVAIPTFLFNYPVF